MQQVTVAESAITEGLLSRAARGDEAAFAALVDRRGASTILDDRAARAEDLP